MVDSFLFFFILIFSRLYVLMDRVSLLATDTSRFDFHAYIYDSCERERERDFSSELWILYNFTVGFVDNIDSVGICCAFDLEKTRNIN